MNADLPEMEELVQLMQHQQAEIDRIRQDIDTVLVSGYSRNDEVTATLRGTGRFTEFEIDPEALRRYDARDIGEVIAEAANDALEQLARLAEQRLAPVLSATDELT
ncbi:hypothetical protein SAMN02982929_01857 [Saccharopolyspora kobensis]|uniref:DNA-binding protein YbaB n=1 Tax=Saccharopolyspora kobensis TaxID=146035 RepID=A0A1H5ZKY5_9PSEU|nr:YbaB/EbfC family nucleoid-associated protein [Saccharopolyspora kobensis]SEG36654.1 hypothetical protein SAMN02982929_01857 [Saccharopolyspora kobensis]SFF20592.1 hypothetical protein SAMN05216506_12214 [Saccharopolyspora kobensis]